MHFRHPVRDLGRVAKACATNALAACMPSLYVKWTGETGRGNATKTPSEEAEYFTSCYADYLHYLQVATAERQRPFHDMDVLEYGPGSILGTALLIYAQGARHVDCVDQFPLISNSSHNADVYRSLLARLPASCLPRGEEAFSLPGEPAVGFNEVKIRYSVRPGGLSSAMGEYDVVLSRAVLEHVGDLPSTFGDMFDALRPGGVAIHKVDLTSHGLDRYSTFDFLTWPTWLYRLMYCRKGYPNRWRAGTYRDLASAAGFETLLMETTGCVPEQEVAFIWPQVPAELRRSTQDELGWMGFWMVLRKPC